MRLPLLIAGGIAAFAALAVVAVNVLISADWVRDRVAARIKEETGRELKVNGTTTILFTPSPRITITDATISDPEARAGTGDFSVARLAIDLSLGELLSRQVDAERVVLVRPVLTLRLGSEAGHERRSDAGETTKPRRFIKAASGGDDSRGDVRLKDVQIEDGTVNLIAKDGKVRRVEHIDANLSLPAMTDPFTGKGNFDWKAQTVSFSFELASPADLRDKRPARLLLAVDTPAIAARFDGSMLTHPSFSGQGELSAKANSIPSLLAWMREGPAAEAAIGDGELSSRIAWKEGEIAFTDARFALQHASGQGQAVVTFTGPRPHIRAALALDNLNLNPFLASAAPRASGAVRQAVGTRASEALRSRQSQSESIVPLEPPPAAMQVTPPPAESTAPPVTPSPAESVAPRTAPPAEMQAAAPLAPPPVMAQIAAPAAFDADINLNVRKTRVSHLDIGPSSLGLVFRDGVLEATLGGMELYDGNASGKLRLDAAKPIPDFSGDFRLDGVQVRPFLSDAAQFSLLSGRTKLELSIAGSGSTSEEIKSSLQGQGSVVVSDGAIEGLNITELIGSVGAGQIPNMRQGPGAKTVFSDLGGSFVIANGVAETENLQMQSPLLKVKAAGTVNLVEDSLNILAQPEIVAGPEGSGGANDLAGLRVPLRIEGPLQNPGITPELKGLFADPQTAGQTVNQIGEVLQRKLKGRPVGEALGRFLGNVQIETRGGDGEAPAPRPRSGQAPAPPAQPAPDASEQGDSGEPDDPHLKDILR
ncbi:MAG: AsmA family protein [Methyloceanibacter sp.]